MSNTTLVTDLELLTLVPSVVAEGDDDMMGGDSDADMAEGDEEETDAEGDDEGDEDEDDSDEEAE